MLQMKNYRVNMVMSFKWIIEGYGIRWTTKGIIGTVSHSTRFRETVSERDFLLYCIVMYLFASKESHYITMDKSQQYTYHANKTKNVQNSMNIPQSKATK